MFILHIANFRYYKSQKKFRLFGGIFFLLILSKIYSNKAQFVFNFLQETYAIRKDRNNILLRKSVHAVSLRSESKMFCFIRVS